MPSNKSFTLTTPPDHLEPGDCAETGLPVALVTPHSRHTFPPQRVVLTLLTLVLGLSSRSRSPAPPPRQDSVREEVLNDWYDNGRIDRLYPLHCYEEAIDAHPDRHPRLRGRGRGHLARAPGSARGELDAGWWRPHSGRQRPARTAARPAVVRAATAGRHAAARVRARPRRRRRTSTRRAVLGSDPAARPRRHVARAPRCRWARLPLASTPGRRSAETQRRRPDARLAASAGQRRRRRAPG